MTLYRWESRIRCTRNSPTGLEGPQGCGLRKCMESIVTNLGGLHDIVVSHNAAWGMILERQQ